MLWVAGGVLANMALHAVDLLTPTGLASLNLIYWLAGIVAIRRLLASRTAPVQTPDLAIPLLLLLALGITGLTGQRVGIGIVATATALWMLAAAREDRSVFAAASVLLALSTHLVWGRILFQIATPELLKADALLVKTILDVISPGFTLSGTAFVAPGGGGMVMVGACSSFMNVSMALLACVSIIMGLRTHFTRRDVVTLGVLSLAMILTNAARLCLIATQGTASYAYWHDGLGAQLFALLQTATILGLGYLGAVWAGRGTPGRDTPARRHIGGATPT